MAAVYKSVRWKENFYENLEKACVLVPLLGDGGKLLFSSGGKCRGGVTQLLRICVSM